MFDNGNNNFDAIIIGAGINGAGIARDASLRGLRVLLLDKGDIAGGTSSWSTRLIHGGLRYLEHGELGLVRESLRERELLLTHAPHLVRPLPMMLPFYTHNSRGPWTIRAGMLAYDLLSLDKSLDHHHLLTREEALRRAPGLAPEGLQGAALYYDAQVEYAERLVLENALDAMGNGATIRTYARVDRLITDGASVRGVEFTDLLEGSGGQHRAHAPVTLNVAGPWVDQIIQSSLTRPARRLIGGTKGSHLVVGAFPGAPLDALYIEALLDQRPFFIIPWNNQYLIGTTDLRYDGDLDHVEARDEEIDYLLRETNRVIPQAGLERASILYTYSGVRPLPFTNGADEKSITRRHFIHDHAPNLAGLLSIVGGKLTTYRRLSEQAVDSIFRKLGRKSPRRVTARRPLPGASCTDFAAFREGFKKRSPLPEMVNERLLRIYGTRATLVLELAAQEEDLREAFSPETGAIGAEVLISFRHELARTLGDCLLRRTMAGLGPSAGLEDDERAARLAQKYLGWSGNFAEREVAAYREYVRRFHPRFIGPAGS